MKNYKFLAIFLGTLLGAALLAPKAEAQTRNCWIGADGQRHCQVVGGGGGHPGYPPPQPPRPPRPQPPIYNPPPNYPPPVYHPRPPVYNPPVYNPPPYRPPYNPPPVYNPPPYQPPTYSWDFYRVDQLASELELGASSAWRLADNEARWSNNSQQSFAVFKLNRLLTDVRDFRNNLRRYSGSASLTASDFRRLKQSFQEAHESMYWAYFSSSVDLEFDRVERTMRDLDQIYWGY